jgi:tRNA (guanine37-N1)-methyltransferase
MALRIDIISANPAITESSLTNGLISRAITKDLLEVFVYHLRDFAEGKYKQIDDEPYGGGSGMILKPEPIFRCVRKLLEERDYDDIIYLSPQGIRYSQKTANNYSLKNNLIIICGHYRYCGHSFYRFDCKADTGSSWRRRIRYDRYVSDRYWF